MTERHEEDMFWDDLVATIERPPDDISNEESERLLAEAEDCALPDGRVQALVDQVVREVPRPRNRFQLTWYRAAVLFFALAIISVSGAWVLGWISWDGMGSTRQVAIPLLIDSLGDEGEFFETRNAAAAELAMMVRAGIEAYTMVQEEERLGASANDELRLVQAELLGAASDIDFDEDFEVDMRTLILIVRGDVTEGPDRLTAIGLLGPQMRACVQALRRVESGAHWLVRDTVDANLKRLRVRVDAATKSDD